MISAVSGDGDQRDRLLERASLRVQTQLGVEHANVRKLASTVFALVELLIERGLLDGAEVAERIARAGEQLGAGPFADGARVAAQTGALDDKRAAPNAEVDCDARMPLCRAVCCTMQVPLAPQDLEEGVVRWDPGRPFYLRRDDDALCSHLERASGRCGVYDDRPRTCRTYSCAGDARIWRDFDARVPNVKGIAALFAQRAERPVVLAGHAATLPDAPIPPASLRPRR